MVGDARLVSNIDRRGEIRTVPNVNRSIRIESHGRGKVGILFGGTRRQPADCVD